ncbi:16079_t:CDS:2, partial [Racocetra fulgida]
MLACLRMIKLRITEIIVLIVEDASGSDVVEGTGDSTADEEAESLN